MAGTGDKDRIAFLELEDDPAKEIERDKEREEKRKAEEQARREPRPALPPVPAPRSRESHPTQVTRWEARRYEASDYDQPDDLDALYDGRGGRRECAHFYISVHVDRMNRQITGGKCRDCPREFAASELRGVLQP